MIKPLYRIGLTLGAMVLLVAAAASWRMLDSHGVFTAVEPGFDGSCRMVASPAGPEDIAIDGLRKLAFISATDRKAFKAGKPSDADGIYVYAYDDAKARPVKLQGAPKDFHPHGISLTKTAEGEPMLVAINHLADGRHVIEVFALSFAGGKVTMTETGRISSGLLVSPNAVAALDETHFYVVNDHLSESKIGRWLDDTLALPRADILYFDGDRFKQAAKGVNYPNGAALSPDGKYLYVAQSFARRLSVFERAPYGGMLKEIKTIAIAAALDNLRVDGEGAVWIAAKPKPWAMGPYRKDASQPVPSEVYRLAPGADKAKLVYANLGREASGASVAAVEGKTLLIGSAYGRKIWNCTMK